MSEFPPINWITDGSEYFDYRPAIGPDGETVIFERGTSATAEQELYIVTLSGGTPEALLPDLTGAQSRVDWCWATNELAFVNAGSVTTVNADSVETTALPGTGGFTYPQWSIAGETLTVMNTSDNAAPQPCSSVVDPLSGAVLVPNINGADANGTAVYGGMPAVNPNTADLVAFAGQPALANWNPGSGSPAYNQNYNYIFLNFSIEFKNFSSSPMETGASIDAYDPSFQGRAPAWSPSGQYLVFESNRDRGYALFLMNMSGTNTPVQLTDTQYGAQHAKFFPDEKRLIFCAKPAGAPKYAIAWIDISGFIS